MSIRRKRKSFSIIVVSDSSSKIRKFEINLNIFRTAFIFFIIFAASVALLTFNFFVTKDNLDSKIAELERLKYLVNYKDVEIANLEESTEEIKTKTRLLENYLSDVEDLDKMVRDITGKGGYEEEVTIYTTDLSADVEFSSDASELFYYEFAYEEDLNDMNAILDDLLSKAPELSERLSEDKLHMEDHIYLMDHTPSIWPTWGQITGVFGEYRGTHQHMGLDIGNNTGTPVNAAASGVVIYAGWHGGFGNKIIIYHGFSTSTVYAHLSKINVSVGDEVEKGQLIGEVGNTGNSTGPHLHYEVIVDGANHDPVEFLP